MSLAIPYRDHSRTPLAFTLSVLLHGLLAGALLAFLLIHPASTPVARHSFELVSGPTTADNTGPTATPGPLLSVPNLHSVDTTPVTQPPAETAQAQPTQVTPAPTPPKPNAVSAPPKPTTTVSPRGVIPVQNKQPKIMTAEEWQKLHPATNTTPTRGPAKSIPKVGVSTDGIMDNLNKLVSGGGSTSRSGNSGNKSNVGDNGESDNYFARVIQQLQSAFVPPPAVDGLSATVRLVIGADGTVISAHILQRSPDDRFNMAVSAALARLKNVGPPPGGEQLTKDFVYMPSAL